MRQSSIYTRKRMGLDNNVLLLMLVFLILSLCLLGYGLSNSFNRQSGLEVHFTINGLQNVDSKVYNTDDILLFRTPISPDYKVIWDFGDNSDKEEGFAASHIFKEPGTYNVTATINGINISVKKVKVNKPAIVIDTTKEKFDGIIGNDKPETGITEKYTTNLSASTYEWSIENNPNFVPRNTKETSFKFRVGGNYVIKLVLDNDKQKTYRKGIVVIDAEDEHPKGGEIIPKGKLVDEYVVVTPKEKDPEIPPQVASTEPKPAPPAPPVKKRPMFIDDAIFKEMLQSFVCGETKQDEFYKYLCFTTETKVSVENNKSIKSFQSLCGEIQPGKKGPKKIEIKQLELVRDNDCIINIKMRYEEKKGLLPGKGPCGK